MKKSLKILSDQIELLALKTVVLDAADIAGLGEVLRILETLEGSCAPHGEKLLPLVKAMKSSLERVILGEEKDLAPFEEGISALQELCRDLKRKKPTSRDVQPLLERLGGRRPAGDSRSSEVEAAEPSAEPSAEGSAAPAQEQGVDQRTEKAPCVTEEDKQIIREFVDESLESLESIEVRLLDLDQDPKDGEAINAIFRPFHTIKGVSGFLNFTRINQLAHGVENLLDKVRNKEITMDGAMVDLILGSVDTLKKMIRNVEASLTSGMPSEGEVDIRSILDSVERWIALATGPKKPLGEILVQRGSVSREDLDQALVKQKDSRDKLGEILIEEDRVETREVLSALRDQKRVSPAPAYQVKVDTLKLDAIVDMVGELAIAQTMLRQNDIIKSSSDRKLYQITNQLSLIVSGLQSTAMSLRMIPIGSTFQKMHRMVRDLGRKSGKDVRLVLSGEETEIDRSMVDEIYEPLVHMIRNAIDHGLETPEEREKAQKSRQGTIFLRAYYRGGDIVIEIEDDGRGLNREKILKKALALGLIQDGDKLGDRELHQLIFHPGFSTAEKVTDISGRGVGTDVVMSKVQKLRGRVEVRSRPGQGTTFVIHLPLTLAIIDGIIIKAGGERYIIPTLNVQESFRLQQKDVTTVTGKGDVLKVRDSLIPLLPLKDVFQGNGRPLSEKDESGGEGKLAVVVESQDKKRCLLVDELLGKEEIVIKSLGGWLRNVRGIAGGAILGDGTVGLILDVAGLLDLAVQE